MESGIRGTKSTDTIWSPRDRRIFPILYSLSIFFLFSKRALSKSLQIAVRQPVLFPRDREAGEASGRRGEGGDRAAPHEPAKSIIFTSGATESMNIVLNGVMEKHGYEGVVITSAIEHPRASNRWTT
eukprot:jgi/Mesvir1/2613/Mv05572-RA.1